MAKLSGKTAVITVNSVDISDHVRSVSIEIDREELDFTGFGSSYKEIGFGLGDVTITLEVFHDYAASETHATLFALSTSDTPFPVTVKPTNAAISATNPEFQMTALMGPYSPVALEIGAESTTEVTFRNASQTGLVADTTP